MKQTTMGKARRHGVTVEDLQEFAGDYGWSFVKIIHCKRGGFEGARDVVEVEHNGTRAIVEIMMGICWECKEKCVSYGWSDGGVHTATCSCKVQDFSL